MLFLYSFEFWESKPKGTEQELRQSVTGLLNFDVSLLPNTVKGSGMQMIDVTGVRLLSSATSSGEIEHLPLFRYEQGRWTKRWR